MACSFPNEHFLYNTGFMCDIFEDALEKGQEYDVIIRLRNQFDAADVRDVITGQKISV